MADETNIEIKVSRRDHPYAQIDNRPLRDKRLSYRARGILAYLLSKPPGWKVRTTDVVANGTEGREAIRAAFGELKAVGYATLKKTQSGSQWEIRDHDGTDEMGQPLTRTAQKPVSAHRPESRARVSGALKNTDERILNQHKDEAEAIYAAYPRKVARPLALISIAKAIERGTPADRLLALTKQYAEVIGLDISFCPNTTTFYNQDRFNDDPSTWKRHQNGTDKKPSPGSRAAGTANENKSSQYRHLGKVQQVPAVGSPTE